MKYFTLILSFLFSLSTFAKTTADCSNLLQQIIGQEAQKVEPARVLELGEEFAPLSKNLDAFEHATGHRLEDTGLKTCLSSFGDTAIKIAQHLLIDASVAKTDDEAAQRIILQMKKIFKDTDQSALSRLCGLASPQAKCKFFSASIAKAAKCP